MYTVQIRSAVLSRHATKDTAARAASKEYKRLEKHCKKNPQEAWKMAALAVHGPDGKVVEE